MRAGPVLLISAIAHAVLLAYVAHVVYGPRQRARKPDAEPPHDPAQAPAPPAAPAPIEIALLDEPVPGERPARPARSAPGTRPARPAAAAVAIAASAGGAESTPGRGGERAPGTGHGLMKMRGAQLELDRETAERIAAAGGAPPDELRRSGKLDRAPGGRGVIHDRVTTVSVGQDGTAHFHDAKDLDPRLQLPIPRIWEVERMRRELGDALTEWYEDPEAGKRFGPTSELPRHLLAAPGACDSWGATMCDDPFAPKTERLERERRKVLGGFLGGPLDITAWLNRKYVGDPYASRKRQLLADTFDERVAMGTAHRAEQRARSAEIMHRNLERLWARVTDPVARRAALFELWDECAEDEAGLRARAVVIGWIRAHLPAGSPDAYTADELAALAARRTSAAVFEPYASP